MGDPENEHNLVAYTTLAFVHAAFMCKDKECMVHVCYYTKTSLDDSKHIADFNSSQYDDDLSKDHNNERHDNYDD